MVVRPLKQQSQAGGFSILELVVAVAVLLIALAGIFAVNGRVLQVLMTSKQQIVASQLLVERADDLRAANWQQLLSQNGISGILASPTEAEAAVTENVNLEEQVIIEDLRSNQTLSAIRKNGQVTTSGAALQSPSLVRTTVLVSWDSYSGRQTRRHSTLLSERGIGIPPVVFAAHSTASNP